MISALDALTLTKQQVAQLAQHHWPGNIRELQNVIRRAIALSDDNIIGADDLPVSLVAAAEAANGSPTRSFFDLRSEYVSRFEREYFTSLLKRHTGNVKESACEARLPRGTLYRLLSSHSIDPALFRERG